MSVSCSCGDFDHDWFYEAPQTWTQLNTSKRKRCFSCNTLMDIGSDVGCFGQWRPPRTDIEERIYGDEVPMANFYMCETCVGLFWSMIDLGFCVSLNKGESMAELAKQSQDIYA